MLKKLILGLTALVGASAAVPSSAEARGYYRGYDYGYYDAYAPRHYGYVPRHYGYAPRHYGYAPRYYGYGGSYAPRYYGRPRYAYRDRSYGRDYRCGNGTAGAIIGGAAGALLGREIGRGGGYYSYRRGNGTTGAIVGGAAGALIGREIGRRC